MEDKINQRLESFIKHSGFQSLRAFDKFIGVAPNQTHNIVGSKQCKPSSEFLELLGNKFENLNMRWLITGHGDMESPEFVKRSEIEKLESKLNEVQKRLESELSEAKEEITNYKFMVSMARQSQSVNFQPVSWEKPVSQPFMFFANSLANVSYSSPISA